VTCAEASLELTSYLDQELAPSDRRTLEEHVAGCQSCGRLLASLQGASLGLRDLAPIEVGEDFRRRVLGEVAAEPSQEGAWAGAQLRPGNEGRRRQLRRWAWPTIGALGTLGAAAAAVLTIVRGPIPRGDGVDALEQDLAIAGQLELFENYQSVQLVDEIQSPEDVQVVTELDRLGPPEEGAR
jgi:anti-sigma factor RsiW